jgi:putative nucleotidyltransferase with HDIG domain
VLNDQEASAGQIAALIEKDSVLSGSVLRCVNSAYYGLPSKVSSIRHAVTLLGFNTVRNLALAFSMRQMLGQQKQLPSRIYSSYSQHALACGVMAQFLAHYVRSEDMDAAFAAGLFHDIGKLLMLTTFPEVVNEVMSHWEAGEGSYEDSERTFFGLTHSELSNIILEKWELPGPIRDAALHHHHPGLCPGVEQDAIKLVHLVHAADCYVRSLGIETLTSATHPPEDPDAAFEAIGLAGRLPEFLDRFQAQFESIRGLFA